MGLMFWKISVIRFCILGVFTTLWTARQNVPGLGLKDRALINEISNIELFPFNKMPKFTAKSTT